MKAMFDVQCRKCRRKYGWGGEVLDQPPCPYCGTKPDPEKLAHDASEIKAFRELLAKRAKDCTGPELAKKREGSGLFLHIAAVKLHIPHAVLTAMEEGRVKPTDEQAARMDKLYGDE